MNVDPLTSTAVSSSQVPTPLERTTSTGQSTSILVESRAPALAECAIGPSIAAANGEEKVDTSEGPQTGNAVAPEDPPPQQPAVLTSRQLRAQATAVWHLVLIMAGNAAQITAIVILAVVAFKSASPANPAKNEWYDSGIGFGLLDMLWIARTVGSALISIWECRAKLRPNPTVFPPLPAQDVEAAVPATAGEQPSTSSAPIRAPRWPVKRVRLWFDVCVTSGCIAYSYFLVLDRGNVGRHQCPHLFWPNIAILAYSIVLFPKPYFYFLVTMFICISWIVLAPINPILVRLGRRPIGTPITDPTIGKLSQSLVSRIPLVLYIPHPPESESSAGDAEHKGSKEGSDLSTKMPARPKAARLRGQTWEDSWARKELRASLVDLPLVRMEENRATCMICHEDFEPPPRVGTGGAEAGVSTAGMGAGSSTSKTTERVEQINAPIEEPRHPEFAAVPLSAPTTTSRPNPLALPDVGEGAQPLRLLGCGHAFHKTCVDTWLMGVSGRCPTCSAPINIRELKKKKKKRK